MEQSGAMADIITPEAMKTLEKNYVGLILYVYRGF